MKIMKTKVKIPKMTIGYGYSGVWANGTIGWFAPMHVHSGTKKCPDEPRAVDPQDVNYRSLKGKRLFYCKIIVTPVLDKLGRPITKIVR
jgi:hypothetical protein